MTHFTVLVRAPAKGALVKHLERMLLPYKEAGCGSDDPPELEQYLEFEDDEEEYKKEWETETIDFYLVRNDKDGRNDLRLVLGHDECFRVPGSFGYGSFGKTGTHVVPEGTPKATLPKRLAFPSLEIYAEEWHGREGRDPKKGRYGHWHNPNQKWDWYAVGGRWPDRIPLLPLPDGSERHANYARVSEVDLDRAHEIALGKFEQFWSGWVAYCKTGKEPKDASPFDGPRSEALDMGLLSVVDGKDLTGREWRKFQWPPDREGNVRDRWDVPVKISHEDARSQFADYFSPITTWARLDANGWVEKGEMGWWCASDATPESTHKHVSGLYDWLRSGDQNDRLVMVDCHI